MLVTSFSYVTPAIVKPVMSGAQPIALAKAAALVGLFVYLCGVITSFFLPEPKGEELPE
jgi:hypothetical protein